MKFMMKLLGWLVDLFSKCRTNADRKLKDPPKDNYPLF